MAQAVKSGESVAIVREPSATVSRMICERGARVVPISVDAGSEADAAATLEAARGCSVLVVDGYGFGPAYLQLLSDVFTCYVDDLGEARCVTPAILNHNLYGEELEYAAPPGTLKMLGPRYALVADSFVQARDLRRLEAPDRARRLLVTFGGSDPTDETTKALDAVDLLEGPYDVDVVVGGANPRLQALTERAKRSRHSVRVRDGLRDLAPLLLESDLVITAGGVTCSELACIGVPAIAIAVADNQRRVVATTGKLGVALALGGHEDVTARALGAAVEQLARDPARRAEMMRIQRSYVDGRGKERVVTELARAATGGRHGSH